MRQKQTLQIPSKKFFFALLFIYMFCFQPGIVGADNFDIIPYVALREEYNDNLFFSVNDEIDDFITIITPGLEFVEKTERLLAELSGRIDRVIYAENDILNATDEHYAGNLSYQLNPRMNFLADVGYSKDSRRDSDVVETGLVLSTAGRERVRFSAGGNYLFTEIAEASMSYLYKEIEYDDPEFVDSQEHRFNLGYIYRLEKIVPTALARLNLGYARYDFESSWVDYYSGTMGTHWNYSEILSLLIDLGIRYTRTEFEVDTNKETNEEWGGVGYLTFSYKGEFTVVDLTFSHDITEASGRGGTTVNTSVIGYTSRKFTDKFRAFLSASYYKNKAEQGELSADDINERTFRIRSGLHYHYNEDLSLEAAYQYTLVDDRVDDTEANRNLIYGEIRWQWPLLN